MSDRAQLLKFIIKFNMAILKKESCNVPTSFLSLFNSKCLKLKQTYIKSEISTSFTALHHSCKVIWHFRVFKTETDFYIFSVLFNLCLCRSLVHLQILLLLSLSLSPQALGSIYFIHKTLKNIYQYDFNGKTLNSLCIMFASIFLIVCQLLMDS